MVRREILTALASARLCQVQVLYECRFVLYDTDVRLVEITEANKLFLQINLL